MFSHPHWSSEKAVNVAYHDLIPQPPSTMKRDTTKRDSGVR